MLNRIVFSIALIAAVSGSALAQNATDKPQETKPAKVTEPTKTDKAKSDSTKDKASPATLKVGSKAPAIKVDKWVKGDEVKSFEKGKVYVVEFWATWCGPCKAAIPHMTDLAKQYKDVTFMGIAASERKEADGTDKRLEKLTTFVKEQSDAMGYHVAYDSDRKMGTPWMNAAGQESIPAAFIVNGEGKIAWIGHPTDLDAQLATLTKPAKTSDSHKKSEEKKKEKGKG